MKKIRIFRKHYEKEKIEKESEKEDEKNPTDRVIAIID
jgi:hypothetical protein